MSHPVKIAEQTADLESYLSPFRKEDLSIGFVPTMGALHKGHASLLQASAAENDITVCSIFVNPTQFTDPKDLINYPRTVKDDIAIAESAGANIVFIPSVSEIYPENPPQLLPIRFEKLEYVMEGVFRPGHFTGVATVVKRLFDIVRPTTAYFGEKDFQQLMVIQSLVEQYKIPLKIKPCKTLRETDGLAMSSRNVHLSPEQRAEAALLFKALSKARENSALPVKTIKQQVQELFNSTHYSELEYFEICDPKDLSPLKPQDKPLGMRAFIAAKVGKTRLIDNMSL